MITRAFLASIAMATAAAAVFACVGDDPTGGTTSSDAGNGGTNDSAPADATSTSDGASATDAGPCDLSLDFSEATAVDELDGPTTEGSLALSSDEQDIVFSSLRDEIVPDGAPPADNSNLWFATRSDPTSPFGAPSTAFTSAINAVGKMDTDPTLSPNGLLLIWTQRMTEGGSEHLFQYAERISRTAAFEPRGAVTFGGANALNPGGAYPKGAFLLPNGALYLVMLTDADDAYKVYRAAPMSLGKFAMPVEQTLTGGQHIFSDSVVVSPDEKTMYIGVLNGAGIRVLTRSDPQDPWGPPRALAKISSASWDAPRWLSSDGCRLYFASGRTGAGDLFVARRK